MADWRAIGAGIAAASGQPFELAARTESGGGCINRAYVLTGTDASRWFVKLNAAHRRAMFDAEAAGLRAIQASASLRVPTPLCSGADATDAWLALEYLDLSAQGDAAELGQQLATMHRHSAARFGWHIDNCIGATPQENAFHDDWIEFWRQRRLLPQLQRAARRGLSARVVERGERLAAQLDGFFPGYRPQPSLLHGDLWGGNAAYAEGRPVVFDPAVYYGDRETDLAMSELFGGFSASFYAAYRAAWPLDPGYGERCELYNLYHVLNHYNLFGGGYAAQAAAMIDRLLALAG